jgi:hypothetical protein
MAELRFLNEDGGNCRVYFKRGTALYCWQDEGYGDSVRFEFYRCSKDGEPSHPVSPPEVVPAFDAETRVGRNLVTWLSSGPG